MARGAGPSLRRQHGGRAVDVTFTACAAYFLRLATRRAYPDTLFIGGCSIEGDTETGLRLKNVLDAIELSRRGPTGTWRRRRRGRIRESRSMPAFWESSRDARSRHPKGRALAVEPCASSTAIGGRFRRTSGVDSVQAPQRVIEPAASSPTRRRARGAIRRCGRCEQRDVGHDRDEQQHDVDERDTDHPATEEEERPRAVERELDGVGRHRATLVGGPLRATLASRRARSEDTT